jgi:phytoene/squalene synthetase
MNPTLAAAVTRAASTQTYLTIRFLVDPARREDAFRAYAYFRWIDDILDADEPASAVAGEAERTRRLEFLERQQRLLGGCLDGDPAGAVSPHEAMLVELVEHARPALGPLETYLRNMMQVMQFDVRRRGHLISQEELSDYTRWLATAVTEAMHYFLGNGAAAPRDGTRYLAVSGAHILHMLRDTDKDLESGYFNIPREVLEAGSIGPHDVGSDAYRAWVAARVELARECFVGGRAYFARVESRRHRLAGLAYMARFEWMAQTLERERFMVRRSYGERRSLAAGLRMSRLALSWMVGTPKRGTFSPPIGTPQSGPT